MVMRVLFAFTDFAAGSGQSAELEHIQDAAALCDGMVELLER
jgi:hypothetical protein